MRLKKFLNSQISNVSLATRMFSRNTHIFRMMQHQIKTPTKHQLALSDKLIGHDKDHAS